MISAKELRKKFNIPEKIKIKDILIRYFNQEMKKILKYINKKDGPFGLSFSLNQALKYYNCPYCVTCEKKEVTQEVNLFMKEIEDLGYFIQNNTKPNDIEFAIYWTQVKNINE